MSASFRPAPVDPAHADRGAARARLPPTLAANLSLRRIPKLDALRAVSALIVVVYHFGLDSIPAGTGVMVFFVISGFLITWLLLAEYEKRGTISLGHFYFRRTFRIFPAFYVFWGIVVGGLILRHGHLLWGQAISTFLYVGNYYQGLNHYPETGLSHAWSLGVEEQYYLIWPAIFVWLAGKPVKLARVIAFTIVGVWIYRCVLNALGVPEYYIYTAFDTRMDQLLVGCLLAIMLWHGYLAGFWEFVCSRAIWMLVPLTGLALSIMTQHRFGTEYRNTIGFMIEPPLIAVLMAQLIASRHGWLQWLDSRAVVFLGTISYSLYLYHELSGALVGRAIGHRMPTVAVLALTVAADIAVASASYFVVERPFLRIREKIEQSYRARKGRPVGTSVA